MGKDDAALIIKGLAAASEACKKATEAFQELAWSMPGKWPDPFVVLKRADRTGRQEQPFGGDLWDSYPRPVA